MTFYAIHFFFLPLLKTCPMLNYTHCEWKVWFELLQIEHCFYFSATLNSYEVFNLQCIHSIKSKHRIQVQVPTQKSNSFQCIRLINDLYIHSFFSPFTLKVNFQQLTYKLQSFYDINTKPNGFSLISISVCFCSIDWRGKDWKFKKKNYKKGCEPGPKYCDCRLNDVLLPEIDETYLYFSSPNEMKCFISNELLECWLKPTKV